MRNRPVPDPTPAGGRRHKQGSVISSAIYYFADSYNYKDVTVTGSLATGDLKYTIRLYATDYQTGGLEIRKVFTGLTNDLIGVLKETLTFTVTVAAGETVADVSFADFTYGARNDFYYYRLPERLSNGTYTVIETGYAVDGYTMTSNTENSIYVADQSIGYSTCSLNNAYSGQAYRVVFLAGDHVVMNISYNSTATEDSYTRFVWMDLNEEYKWSVDQSGTGVVRSNLAAHYDFNQSQLDSAEGKITVLNALGVTADRNWNFDGFYLVQEEVMRDVAYSDLAGVMALSDEPNVQAGEDGVKTLTFEASYSNEDDGDSDREPPIAWPDDPTDIPDEGTPLADAPATNDSTGIWVLAAGVSDLALVWLALTDKKRRDDKA